MATIIKRKNVWCARFWVDGRRIEKTTKVKVKGDLSPPMSKKLAQQTADLMEAAACGRTSVKGAVEALEAMAEAMGIESARTISVKKFFAVYEPSGGLQNISNTMRAINRFLSFDPALVVLRMDQIRPSHCLAWLKHESARVSSNTVRCYRAFLSAAFNRALRDGVVSTNPFLAIKPAEYAVRDSVPVKRVPFTPEEINMMIRDFPSPWSEMVLISFLTGGQRIGDVACLKWESVDFEAGIVAFYTSKTRRLIEASMVRALRMCLTRLKKDAKEGEEYVLPDMAARYRRSKGALSVEFTALLRAAGIAEKGAAAEAGKDTRRSVSTKSFHCIRHSVVSMLRSDNSFSADIARAIVGHDSEAVEREYFTAPTEKKRAGMDFLAEQAGLA